MKIINTAPNVVNPKWHITLNDPCPICQSEVTSFTYNADYSSPHFPDIGGYDSGYVSYAAVMTFIFNPCGCKVYSNNPVLNDWYSIRIADKVTYNREVLWRGLRIS